MVSMGHAGIGRLETLKTLNSGVFDSDFKTLQDTMKRILKVYRSLPSLRP